MTFGRTRRDLVVSTFVVAALAGVYVVGHHLLTGSWAPPVATILGWAAFSTAVVVSFARREMWMAGVLALAVLPATLAASIAGDVAASRASMVAAIVACVSTFDRSRRVRVGAVICLLGVHVAWTWHLRSTAQRSVPAGELFDLARASARAPLRDVVAVVPGTADGMIGLAESTELAWWVAMGVVLFAATAAGRWGAVVLFPAWVALCIGTEWILLDADYLVGAGDTMFTLPAVIVVVGASIPRADRTPEPLLVLLVVVASSAAFRLAHQSGQTVTSALAVACIVGAGATSAAFVLVRRGAHNP